MRSCLLILLLLSGGFIASATATPIPFIYKNPIANNVTLVGSFNGWNASANPLQVQNSVWQTSVDLKPGRYLYKFVVDGQWLSDPANPVREPDGYEGFNSILHVEAPLPEIRAVMLAGDLTSWDPANPATAMAKTSATVWEKALHLPPGVYHFKIALNGGSHWLSGEISSPLRADTHPTVVRLATPGQYLFRFDQASRRVDVQSVPHSQPIAVITGPALSDVEGPTTWDLNLPLTLSAEHSLPLKNWPFKKYEWRCDQIPQISKDTMFQFTPRQTGLYSITLTASDDGQTVSRTQVVEVKPSAQILTDAGTTDISSRAANMTPGERAGLFQRIFKAAETRNTFIQFAFDHDAAQVYGDSQLGDTSVSDGIEGRAKAAPLNAPIPCPIVAGKFYKVTFDRDSKAYAIHEASITEFSFDPNRNVISGVEIWKVEVVGEMNNWRGQDMERLSDGTWRWYAELPEGLYAYKIRLNQDIWLEDPNADPKLHRDDLTGHGTFNSVIQVGETGAMFGEPMPHHINAAALKHDPTDVLYFNPISLNEVEITLRTLENDVKNISLFYDAQTVMYFDSNVTLREIKMTKSHSKSGFDFYRARILRDAEKPGFGFGFAIDAKLHYFEQYCFVIQDDSLSIRMSSGGATSPSPLIVPYKPSRFYDYYNVEKKEKVAVPDWARHAVWYNIFPERFRNGNPANDPTTNEHGPAWFAENTLGPFTVSKWTDDWDALQPWEQKYAALDKKCCGADMKHARHYGGDLQGVLEKLPYLADLGITAIWFNPVHYAYSNHKYDAASYHHIDPHFGEWNADEEWNTDDTENADSHGLKEREEKDKKNEVSVNPSNPRDPRSIPFTPSDSLFLRLVARAHELGIKVIIDGVFNHTGDEFWAFERAIWEGPDSPYAKWYTFKSWGNWHADSSLAWNRKQVTYACWWNYTSLPELSTTNPAVREHIFDVTRRWLNPDGDPATDDGIDGFRLDVANEVEPDFWLEWRKVVDAAKPDAYTTGELWAKSPEWVKGDRFTAVMNYPWLELALQYFRDQKKKLKTGEFEAKLRELRTLYPTQVSQAVQNLSGSHDTDRLLSGFINPDRKLDQDNRAGSGFDTRRPWEVDAQIWDKVKLFYLFQMTYVGAPMLYYGDEVGMYGADDPDCRKPMLWADLKYANGEKPNLELLVYLKKLIALRKSSKAFSIGDFKQLLADDEKDVFVYKRSYNDERFIVVLNNSLKPQILDLDVRTSLNRGDEYADDILAGSRYQLSNGRLQVILPSKTGMILK